jgi:predicted dehydrogenase
MPEIHVLVVGAGSVGKRHLKNLVDLGCKVSAMDPREDRQKEAMEQVNLEKTYSDFQTSLDALKEFDGVVIASPPKFHIEQCQAIESFGMPILLEKPVSPGLPEAKTLNATQKGKILLGYSYRWWKPLREFKTHIQNGTIGKILNARFVMSAHLEDWHPWERYQDFFMSSKDLGGGALLDESHFLDLMIWFFGMPESVFSRIEKISSLEIETDDNVDIIAAYQNGLRISIHLDLYGRPHEKYIVLTGEKGTLKWSFSPNCISFSNSAEQEWEEELFIGERNDMFLDTAKEFVAIMKGEIKDPGEYSCSLKDGIDVLEVIEACRQSSMTGKTVHIEKEKQC